MVFRNPATIHSPASTYSHQAEVRGNAKWHVLSGQIGMDKSGRVPEDVASQLENALDNVMLNLEAAGMSKKNLVKLVYYFVGSLDTDKRRSIISKRLGDHHPCSTVLFISGLATKDLKIEIDAWACSE